MGRESNYRVLLADDHKIMREGLRLLIEKHAHLEVVAQAEDGRSAVRLAIESKPDIAILDISMPELNGIEAARQIRSELPGVSVIILSMHSDKHFILESLKAGAAGYLLKDCAFEELAQAISSVTSGKTFLSPAITDVVVSDYLQQISRNDTIKQEKQDALTAREREVTQLISEGKSTKEIATRLCVSVKTIESHRRQIMAKLKLGSIAELTKYAIRSGLTTL